MLDTIDYNHFSQYFNIIFKEMQSLSFNICPVLNHLTRIFGSLGIVSLHELLTVECLIYMYVLLINK